MRVEGQASYVQRDNKRQCAKYHWRETSKSKRDTYTHTSTLRSQQAKCTL